MTHRHAGSDILRRAVELHQAGDLEKAEHGYRRAAELGEPDAAFQWGLLAQDRGDVQTAVQAYEQAAAQGDIEAVLNLARVLWGAMNRTREARTLFEAAAERGDPRAMFELAFFLEHHGDDQGAMEVMRRAVEAGQPRGHLHMGFLLAEHDRDEEALTAFRKAGDAEVAGVSTQIGWQLMRLGRRDDAEQALGHGMASTEPGSYALFAVLLTEAGLGQEAADALEQGMQALLGGQPTGDRSRRLEEEVAQRPDAAALEEWVEEEWSDRIPLPLAALLYDASSLAETETALTLAIEYGDTSKLTALAEHYERTGRHREARALRERDQRR